MKGKKKSLKLKTILLLLVLFGVTFFLITCKKNKTQPDNQYSNSFGDQPINPPLSGLVRASSTEYQNFPTATIPTQANGQNIPASFSLVVPDIPFDQGYLQGSCASCASAMAKSIIDHQFLGVAYSKNSITYSPSYLYSQAMSFPGSCALGSTVISNLNLLQTKGICTLADMPYSDNNCAVMPTQNQHYLAASHKIDHAYKIEPISTATIKQFILAGFPVIVAFKIDDTFSKRYWTASNKTLPWKTFGTYIGSDHATLLYGWDDSKTSFRMLNEWGKDWGDGGSIWVDYDLVSNNNVFTEAYIIVNSAAVNNSNNLQVNGDLTFGNVSLNTPSVKRLELKNSGASDIMVSNISVSAPFTANWLSGTIKAGASVYVDITFMPTTIGAATKAIVITSNALNSAYSIQATGSGISQTTQLKVISLTGNLSFGNVNVGTSSYKTLTITNNGNSALAISSISSPNNFSTNYSGTINAGSSANVSVYFSPSNVQSYSGSIVVNSDATSGNNVISVSGIGIANSNNNAPQVYPSLGTYSACVPNQANPNCGIYTDGVITARVTNIDRASHQVTVEIKKCDGTAFNAGGNYNIVSNLCSGGQSYSFGQFQAGKTSFSVSFTDNNMTGTKIYSPFIVQGASLNIQYDSPYLVVSY